MNTSVWFYNSEGWETVYAYVWNDQGPILNSWPGSEVTGPVDIEMNDLWVYIDIPVDVTLSPINIIFNNGDGTQSLEAVIDSNTNVYMTLLGNVFASKEEAETSMDVSTTIYYYNSEGWTDVYAYVIDSVFVEKMSQWFGDAMTQESDTNWWYIEVPFDTSVDDIAVIFNDGIDQQSAFTVINTSFDLTMVSSLLNRCPIMGIDLRRGKPVCRKE